MGWVSKNECNAEKEKRGEKLSENSEGDESKNKEVQAGSEPCKPTTSVCEKPAHFVRRKCRSVRSAVVPVRLTAIEHESLQTTAKVAGVSLSAFIRSTALKRRLPLPSVSEVNRCTYEELARIGNNLNQLVRAVHGRAVSCVDEGLLRQLCDHVRILALEVLGVVLP